MRTTWRCRNVRTTFQLMHSTRPERGHEAHTQHTYYFLGSGLLVLLLLTITPAASEEAFVLSTITVFPVSRSSTCVTISCSLPLRCVSACKRTSVANNRHHTSYFTMRYKTAVSTESQLFRRVMENS